MKKLFLMGLLLPAMLKAQDKTLYPASPVPDRIMLTFAGEPATSQAVTWRTDSVTVKGVAELKLASPHPAREVKPQVFDAVTQPLQLAGATASYHTVNFTNLQPATQYMYRVGDGAQNWSEWIHFTTAEKGFKPFSFIYMGDAQNDHKSLWSRAIRAAYAKDPQARFMLHAGDLINRTNVDNEWGEWFYAGSWIYSMMPTIATPGNHEYYRDENRTLTITKHWRPMFAFPENGPHGLEERAYYVDYQQLRVISICSQSFLLNPADSVSQMAWLEDLLKNNPNRWTVVTMHHPVFSSKEGRDNKSLRDALRPMFEKYKVDLVLTGHDHTYGRGIGEQSARGKKIKLKGPVYLTSVSGPKQYVPALDGWQQRAGANTQFYQIVKVEENALRYQSFTITGELYDAFDLERKKGTNVLIDKAPAMKELLDLPPSYTEELTAEQQEAYRKKVAEHQQKTSK